MKKHAVILAGIFLSVVLAGATGQQSDQARVMPQAPGAPAGASIRADMEFGRVPLYFIPNEGQLDERVAFSIQGRDKTVYFTPGGVTFSLRKPAASPAPGGEDKESVKGLSIKKDSATQSWTVKLDFVGANAEVKPVGEEKTGGVVSYFKGQPADWQAGLPTYSRIVYRDLWPGIDLAYSGTVNRLKYEFIVHPGADPSRVRLAYRGVERISVDEEGRLEVKSPAGGFKDDVPVAYQEIAGVRKNVPLRYKLDAQNHDPQSALREQTTRGEAHAYGFGVGGYDRTQPLVLDPAFFIFAGFIGGSGNEQGQSIAVDGSGNVYVAGYTNSAAATFPESVGPDLTPNGSYDAFVAKVTASGASLVYCGFIGGAADDRGYGIAVDASGGAYVTGATLSDETTFPVVAGYDLTYNGLADAFIAKVNAAGDALAYCTYIGGSSNDYGYGIAVDGSGYAYIAGETGSSEATFCEVTGPDLSFNGGANDAFVCKLDSTGTARYYCGYIGGSGDDLARGIVVDATGSAYIVGYTTSGQATFPETVGPDLTSNGGNDVFVAKVNAGGASLTYCGYLGGTGQDYGYGIALDSRGCVYLTGYGNSSINFPAVVGPDLTYDGYYDAIVAKVKADGTGLDYCGYIGGTSGDNGYAVAVDPSGSAYVTGYTQSDPAAGFPVADGPDLTRSGTDGFIAKVKASGSGLTYCGYIGGTGAEVGSGIAVDGWGNSYVTGYGGSGTGFPALVGPDLSHNGGNDAFVAKVDYYWLPDNKNAVGDFDGDGMGELAADFGATGAWMWDSGAWTQLSTSNPEGMITANVDGNADDELFLEFGYAGLWRWDGGAMSLLSEADVETMAPGDVDADGSDELVVDFGSTGLWLWDGGSWNQLSGVNLEYMVVANLDGSGGAEITGDFGKVGLWSWSGGAWTQLSGVNVQYMASGNTDGAGGKDLIGDFGPVGLWLLSGGAWEQWSGVNADYMITADIDGSGDDEVFGDFAMTGLWLWDSGAWTIFSGLNADFMISSDTDGDGSDEMVADFETIGIWHWDTGSWAQISGVNPENLMAGDIDGDSAEEILADLGALGLWLWDGGIWSQISANNPD